MGYNELTIVACFVLVRYLVTIRGLLPVGYPYPDLHKRAEVLLSVTTNVFVGRLAIYSLVDILSWILSYSVCVLLQ
jgi:hypothetical protein